MKWNDFLKICKEKLTIPEGELNKLYTQYYDELKNNNESFEEPQRASVEELEEYAVSQLHAYLRRQLSSPAEKFIGVLVGASRPTDFGASKI